MDQKYITAGYITLPLCPDDLQRFGVEAGVDPEGQAVAISSTLKYAATQFKEQTGDVTISVGPQRYKWQADGYYIFISSKTPDAAGYVHRWLEQINDGIEGIILPSTWKATVDDEKKEPRLLQMQKR